jgi:hypothetical protein
MKEQVKIGQLVLLYVGLTAIYIVLPDQLKLLQQLINPVLLVLLAVIVFRSVSSLKN